VPSKSTQPPLSAGIEHIVVIRDPPPYGLALDEQLAQIVRLHARYCFRCSEGFIYGVGPGSVSGCRSHRIEAFVGRPISAPRASCPSPVTLEIAGQIGKGGYVPGYRSFAVTWSCTHLCPRHSSCVTTITVMNRRKSRLCGKCRGQLARSARLQAAAIGHCDRVPM
jgi:hypothetical protein